MADVQEYNKLIICGREPKKSAVLPDNFEVYLFNGEISANRRFFLILCPKKNLMAIYPTIKYVYNEPKRTKEFCISGIISRDDMFLGSNLYLGDVERLYCDSTNFKLGKTRNFNLNSVILRNKCTLSCMSGYNLQDEVKVELFDNSCVSSFSNVPNLTVETHDMSIFSNRKYGYSSEVPYLVENLTIKARGESIVKNFIVMDCLHIQKAKKIIKNEVTVTNIQKSNFCVLKHDYEDTRELIVKLSINGFRLINHDIIKSEIKIYSEKRYKKYIPLLEAPIEPVIVQEESPEEDIVVPEGEKYFEIKGNLQKQVEKTTEKTEYRACSICMDNLSTVILMDCFHQCLCKDCAIIQSAADSKCPICRKDINYAVIPYD